MKLSQSYAPVKSELGIDIKIGIAQIKSRPKYRGHLEYHVVYYYVLGELFLKQELFTIYNFFQGRFRASREKKRDKLIKIEKSGLIL